MSAFLKTFRGCMLKMPAALTAQNYSSYTALPFGANSEVYDTDNFHDTVTANTRLTVPAGVTMVRVGATISPSALASGTECVAQVQKNGSGTFDGAPMTAQYTATTLENPVFNICSGPVPVVGGDYFELFWRAGNDTSSDINLRTYFWIEVIQ